VRRITIYKRIFYDSDCYRSGKVQTQQGVQVHSTGANNPYLKRYVQPNDGRLGENKYNNSHNGPGDVCANAYIGKLQDGTVAIYQTLPWDMRCWLSASGPNGNANKLGYIGFEICEDDLHNAEYFSAAVMDKAVNLVAYLCRMMGTTPDKIVINTSSGPAYAVMDHDELHDVGLASNHGDIRQWLKPYGLNMNDFRKAVQAAMDDGVEAEYIDCDESGDVPVETLYKAKVWAANGYPVKMRANPSQNAKIITTVPLNTVVDVIEETSDKWSKIQYGYSTGYMMREFLLPVSEQETDEITLKREAVKRIYDGLNEIVKTIKTWLEG